MDLAEEHRRELWVDIRTYANKWSEEKYNAHFNYAVAWDEWAKWSEKSVFWTKVFPLTIICLPRVLWVVFRMSRAKKAYLKAMDVFDKFTAKEKADGQGKTSGS